MMDNNYDEKAESELIGEENVIEDDDQDNEFFNIVVSKVIRITREEDDEKVSYKDRAERRTK